MILCYIYVKIVFLGLIKLKYRATYAYNHTWVFLHTHINTHIYNTPWWVCTSLVKIVHVCVSIYSSAYVRIYFVQQTCQTLKTKRDHMHLSFPLLILKPHSVTVTFYLPSYNLNLYYGPSPRVRGNLESLLIESWESCEMSVLLWALLFPEACLFYQTQKVEPHIIWELLISQDEFKSIKLLNDVVK